jgi:two-component system sensor histidine kinase AlgZ
MKEEPQILSAFHELPAEPVPPVPPVPAALVFDACRAGVILRAVLFVEVCVAVGAMFGAAGPGLADPAVAA